jgi:uncharacterized membrane protein YczE
MKIRRAAQNLGHAIEENPVGAIVVGTVVFATIAGATAKMMEANADHRNSIAWNKEVDRRRRSM